ncbi:hypothetical protein MCY_01457 [Bartonella rattimassiliensis 15908]|uniref:Integrase DNA-binding domain-containing protein n=1 Tax=Bartonella rattimassiliensis 15908 TaxID=1094556 RepID=J0QCA1_9HYPH|nr:hypothetical protein MCY_01457 [Bartonella rattimassiliensis 15908]
MYKKGLKMALMNRLNARSVATLGAGKYNDDAGLLLHKHKDRGAQWILRYTLHRRRREMGLGALRNVSLKKPVNWQINGVLSPIWQTKAGASLQSMVDLLVVL